MAGDKPNKLKRTQPYSLLSFGPPYPLISLDSVNELASVDAVLYSAEFGSAGNGFAVEVDVADADEAVAVDDVVEDYYHCDIQI